uniref:CACTA en-spm transposon protein n=1 Tax=Cucumis melo var. makuwa TaxID=1194695 RepID=A0A5A7T909_CUCMM|nr:hypothetical protein E6C27_scaffold471G00250 [Cucumis melo var. makuwa]
MSCPSGFHEADMYLELDDDSIKGKHRLRCRSTHSHFEETFALPELGVGVWIDVPLEYIEIVKVAYSKWKEFMADNHRHFKQFSVLKEVHLNSPPRFMNRMEDW